jgi:hypothetical protein
MTRKPAHWPLRISGQLFCETASDMHVADCDVVSAVFRVASWRPENMSANDNRDHRDRKQ